MDQLIQPKIYLGAKAAIEYTILQSLHRATEVEAYSNYLSINTNANQITVGVLGYEIFPHFLPFFEAGISVANVGSLDTKHHELSNLSTAVSAACDSL